METNDAFISVARVDIFIIWVQRNGGANTAPNPYISGSSQIIDPFKAKIFNCQ